MPERALEIPYDLVERVMDMKIVWVELRRTDAEANSLVLIRPTKLGGKWYHPVDHRWIFEFTAEDADGNKYQLEVFSGDRTPPGYRGLMSFNMKLDICTLYTVEPASGVTVSTSYQAV